MIIRSVDILMVAALLGAATWTFKVKNDSEKAYARIAELERQVEREREAIDLLRADWSLLTSPDRLQQLVERHREELGLEPVRPEQFVTLEQVPLKPPPGPEPEEATAMERVEGTIERPDAISNLLTGSIGN